MQMVARLATAGLESILEPRGKIGESPRRWQQVDAPQARNLTFDGALSRPSGVFVGATQKNAQL
jgi:hypothetical protein